MTVILHDCTFTRNRRCRDGISDKMRINIIRRNCAIVGKRTLVALLAIAALASACHLREGDRCDEDQGFDGVSCVPLDTDSDTDSATDGDGGAGDGGTGMMTPCDGQEDCAELVASYCLDISYGEIVLNGCVIANCSVAPDDCPAPNTCCDLDPTYESMLGLPDTLCMPPEYWTEYSMFCTNA